jgi:hypothetical protein
MKLTHQNEVGLSTGTVRFQQFIDYEFIYFGTGPSGRLSDERFAECTKFYEKLVHEKLNPPLPRKPDIIFVNAIP